MTEYTHTRGAPTLARLLPRRVLIALAAAAFTLAGCNDSPSPLAPQVTAGPLPPASQHRLGSAAADEPGDVIDAMDRIAPAFGSGGPAIRLRVALGQLADAARRGDVDATRREAAVASLALDKLESLGDPSLGAEIDAVRLVVDARK